MIPDHIRQGKEVIFVLHPRHQTSHIVRAIGKQVWVKLQLIKNAVRRVRNTPFHQRRQVDHVIISLADAVQMLIPVLGILSHELGDHRKDRKSVDGEVLPANGQSGRHVDVVSRCLRWRGRCNGGDREVR